MSPSLSRLRNSILDNTNDDHHTRFQQAIRIRDGNLDRNALFDFGKTASWRKQRELGNGCCAYSLDFAFKTPVRVGIYCNIHRFAHCHLTDVRLLNIRQDPDVLRVTDHQHRLAVLYQLPFLDPFTTDHPVNRAPQYSILETLAGAFGLGMCLLEASFQDLQPVLTRFTALNLSLHQADTGLCLLDFRFQRLHLAFAELNALLGRLGIVEARPELGYALLRGVEACLHLRQGILRLVPIGNRDDTLLEESLSTLPIARGNAHLPVHFFDS